MTATALPSRRPGTSYQLTIGTPTPHSVHIRVDRYPPLHPRAGQPCSLWVDMHREGTAYRSALQAIARAVSLSLQAGVAVAEVVAELQAGGQSEPRGAVVGLEGVGIRSAEGVEWLMGAVLALP